MIFKKNIFVLLIITININGEIEECQEAKNEVREYQEDLIRYTKKLYECVNNSNYKDDCYFEFRKVKSIYNDFESAISAVDNECN